MAAVMERGERQGRGAVPTSRHKPQHTHKHTPARRRQTRGEGKKKVGTRGCGHTPARQQSNHKWRGEAEQVGHGESRRPQIRRQAQADGPKQMLKEKRATRNAVEVVTGAATKRVRGEEGQEWGKISRSGGRGRPSKDTHVEDRARNRKTHNYVRGQKMKQEPGEEEKNAHRRGISKGKEKRIKQTNKQKKEKDR